MQMNKLSPTFFPNSHKDICEFGLSGQQHGSNAADVDELLALLTVSYTLCMLEVARRSRSPQMSIAIMLLTDQRKTRKRNEHNGITSFSFQAVFHKRLSFPEPV
jgi:hypothetical protein